MTARSVAELPFPAGSRTIHMVSPLRWTLCAMAFTLALEAPDRFPVEVTTIAGAAFLLCTLLHPRACYGRVPHAVGWFGLYLYVLLVALVFQGSRYPGGLYLWSVTQFLLLLVLWVLVFWVCANLFEHERLSRVALWGFVAGCLVRSAMPLLGLGTTVHEEGMGGGRVTVFGQGANQSAQVLAVGLLTLIGLSYVRMARPGRARLIPWVGVGLITSGLVATGSRGGFVTFAAGLFVILVSGRSLRQRLRNATVALLAMGILAVALSRSELLQRRFSQSVEEGNLSGREQIYPLTVKMFVEKPWLGWGPITNKYELATRLGDTLHERRDAHNAVLEILTASGIAGLIPFAIGTWLCFRSAWLARTGPRGVLPLALLIAVAMVNMSGNRLTAPLTWLVLAYGLASRGAPIPGAPTGQGQAGGLQC